MPKQINMSEWYELVYPLFLKNAFNLHFKDRLLDLMIIQLFFWIFGLKI